MLLSNSNDIRHILKTVSRIFEVKKDLKLNFYVYEKSKENLTRLILFFHILHDSTLSIRERVEIFMEIYGNTLLSSRTAEYINSIYKVLIRFVSGDKKYEGPLKGLIDLSLLSYKDKDDLAEIFATYDLKVDFDVEKYRDDRLRFMYKDRYDVRENLIDWDHNMKMRHFV